MRVAFCVKDDFNLGASYVIAYLKSIKHEVRLFIAFDKDCLSERVKAYRPDLVCFSCVTANYGWASQEAKNIKKIYPVAKILIGGVHPTLCPEEVRKNTDFDMVCEGDGIAYFGGKFDPDTLWADREIFLHQLPPVHRAYQIFMTGFGCPFRCSFCNNHQLRPKITRRSPEGCLAELKHLKERGLKYVLFDDDIFTLNRRWLLSFLPNYQRDIALPYTCFGHTKYVDNEIASLLKSSGCQCVWLGVQSGSEDTRRLILNRTESNAELQETTRIIKKHGLKLMIDHIFGLPMDNEDKLADSYEFYKTLKPDVVNCYELLYFPKAEINKYGHSQALYQKQGGEDYKRYAKYFTAIPLLVN